MKRIFTLVISLIMITATVLGGCGGGGEIPSNIGKNPEPTSFEKTSIVLVSGGNSDYKIVIPSNNVSVEQYIAEELQYFIEQSTNAKLPIITDAGLTHDNTQKYLSIGDTVLLKEQTDIVVDYEVQGASGPLIYRKDNTVYMTGADRYGITNAVYKFLEYHIGFRAYATDCVLFDYYDTLYLQDISYNYVPSIQWLALNEYETYGTQYVEGAARMLRIGYNNDGGYELFGRKTFSNFWCHSCKQIFPDTIEYVDESTGETVVKDVYQYGQPCLSDMNVLKAATQNLIKALLASDGPALMVGMQDSNATCVCEKCLEAVEEFGSQGGIMLNALNVIAKGIEENFKANGVDRKATLVGLVYNGYLGAPVKMNDDGTYRLASDKMHAYDGDLIKVGACIAPMHACFSHPLGDESCENNLSYTQNIKNWRLATDELYFYLYGHNFSGFQTFFYNDWASLNGTFEFFESINTKYVFVESAGSQYSPMSSFRVYYKSRIGWNTKLSFEQIRDEFFPAYYGPAGESLKTYFNQLLDHFEHIYKVSGKDHFGCYDSIGSPDFYPHASLKAYENLLNQAFIDIEQSNCTQKDKEIYKERVQREFLLIKVNEYRLFGDSIEKSEKEQLNYYVQQAKDLYGISVG